MVVSPTLVTFAINPLLGLAVGAALIGAVRIRRIARARSRGSDRRAEEILAADLVASGVEAGVSFDEAVSVASDFVSPVVAAEMRRMARVAHHSAVAERNGSIVDEMFRLSRRSAVSGAPLAPGLRSLSEVERSKDAAERLERLERLPVKLLFPLAFLILPGFLLVAVVPALVSGISKLSL
jgi:pilus assembly protein TadC